MDVYVKTQAELDAIPLDTKDCIYIDFGTKEKPAIVRGQYCYSVSIINNSVVTTYGNSEVCAWGDSQVYAYDNSTVDAMGNSNIYAYDNSTVSAMDDGNIYAYDNSKVWTHNNSIVRAHDNSEVHAYGNSKVYAYNNSKVRAYDNSEVITYNNSEAVASVNSTVYAHENSKVCACSNSKAYAYDNSNVWAWSDKSIISINDNAIVISPSMLCSGAELLNQCNGNIGNAKFAVSNVPDNDKNNAFDFFCGTDDFNKRAFILTMRGVPYYCVYDFDTMSIEFYTMGFCRAFENIADDTILMYYLDNVLMPALVNAKFDKSAKSNII